MDNPMVWKCVECGHEEDERWLMCPECTTAEDWKEVLELVNGNGR